MRLGFGFLTTDLIGDFFAAPLSISKLFGSSTIQGELGLAAAYLHSDTVAYGSRLAPLFDIGLND